MCPEAGKSEACHLKFPVYWTGCSGQAPPHQFSRGHLDVLGVPES